LLLMLVHTCSATHARCIHMYAFTPHKSTHAGSMEEGSSSDDEFEFPSLPQLPSLEFPSLPQMPQMQMPQLPQLGGGGGGKDREDGGKGGRQQGGSPGGKRGTSASPPSKGKA
jgi:hypothetical protein